MSKLEILNKFFLQWLCIRLAKVVDKDTKKFIKWKILKWIVPMTGWTNNYKHLFIEKCPHQLLDEFAKQPPLTEGKNYTLTGTILTDKADSVGEKINIDGVTFPDGEIPVTIQFERGRLVGFAKLRKTEKTVEADVNIIYPNVIPEQLITTLVPAVGGKIIKRVDGVLEKIKIQEVSFCKNNIDPTIKPMKVKK